MLLQRPFATVTPTVDGDVLGVLAAGYDEYTVSRLASLIPERSANGIRKAAERLAEQGIVVTRDAGRTRTYSLNDAHLLAEPIRRIATVDDELIERLRSAVSLWADPPVLGAIFGSAARHEMRVDSDLDVLLVFPAGTSEPGRQRGVEELATQATMWTGNDARVIDLDEDDITSGSHRPLLEAVAREGVTFFGDPGWLMRELRMAGT